MRKRPPPVRRCRLRSRCRVPSCRRAATVGTGHGYRYASRRRTSGPDSATQPSPHCFSWPRYRPPARRAPLPALFSDVIDVRVVNVEVVVTDKKGNRIRGLQASDFELHVDGAPVGIDYFTEVDDGLAKTSSDDGVGNVPALAADEPVGTNYLIFIDDYFSFQRDRDRVLGHLEKDLVQLGPRDRVAIVASDGASLALLAGWTNSASEIQEALREARERPALGLMRLSDRRKLAEASSRLEIDYRKRFLTEQIEQSVLAAVATLRSFASREGRKVMLVLVGGWGLPQYSVYDLPTMIDITTVLGPLANAANRVGYTLYPVDVPGFRGARRMGGAQQPAVPRGGDRRSGHDQRATYQSTSRDGGRHALLLLAGIRTAAQRRRREPRRSSPRRWPSRSARPGTQELSGHVQEHRSHNARGGRPDLRRLARR